MSDYNYRQIDDLIHSRVRLAIMAYLAGSATGGADFAQLKARVSVTDGNLSTHLAKLEEAGYVTTEKYFQSKKPVTHVSLSDKGTQAFKEYVEGLSALLKQ